MIPNATDLPVLKPFRLSAPLPAGARSLTATHAVVIIAALVLAVGIVCAGLGAADRSVPLAAGLIVVGALAFGVASVIAIAGEVETYRALKR